MDQLWRLLTLLLLCGSTFSFDTCTNGNIRLFGGSTYLEGTVEVCYDGNWGTVCDDQWDANDAKVACRKLGFSDEGARAKRDAFFGTGRGPIFLDDLNCTGNESDLFECVSINDCAHSEDAGVICQENDVVLTQNGRLIANNSIISLESLGDSNSSSSPGPLRCVTTKPFCCDTNRSGNWFHPTTNAPLTDSPDSLALYQSWGDDQSIQLNRPSGTSSIESGLYHCEVPDENNITKNLYVGVYPTTEQGAVTISSVRYETSTDTLVCTSTGGPATSVTWLKDDAPLVVDGTIYKKSQIITDINAATYENRLSIIEKTENLSGNYTCIVQNSAGSEQSSFSVTVCRDRSARIVENSQPPSIEVCQDDQWIRLNSDYHINSETAIVRDLVGTQVMPNSVSLSWQVSNANLGDITGYEVTCSSGSGTSSTIRVAGTSVRAILASLPSLTYRCCVTATLNRNLFNLAHYISSECTDVTLRGSSSTSSSSRPIEGLSTVTIALGSLVGVLLVCIVVLMVGCIVVVLSRRRPQKSSQPRPITARTDHLIDNPIYKSSSPVSSSPITRAKSGNLNGINGTSHMRPLSNQEDIDLNLKYLANNPQYGTGVYPPPNHQAPRYIKIQSDQEPTYELIRAPSGACQSATVIENHCEEVSSGGVKVDSAYSTPTPGKHFSNGLGNHSAVPPPVYESTMDIPEQTGKDGPYAKLNHDS